MKRLTKRRVVLLVVIGYLLWKIYVIHTPSTEDDNVPDQVRDVILRLVSN